MAMTLDPWLVAPLSAALSILVGVYLHRYVNRQDPGTERMRFVSGAIKAGSRAFLNRMFRTLGLFVGVMSVVLLLFLPKPIWATDNPVGNVVMTVAYLFGSGCSALAGWLGMDVATDANVRSANSARKGIRGAFLIAFRGGAVMGLSVIGLALLGVSVVYLLTGDPAIIAGFSFGASAMALFAKAGGGIYTKTADIGADLVGKVEMDLPEDDPRNPAVIADNVGDNVGDVAGMGSDLFDSYVASLLAVMLLGGVLGGRLVELPLVFAGLGCLASLVGVAFVRVGEGGDPGRVLNRGTYLTCVVYAALTLAASSLLGYNIRIWAASAVGLVAGVVIGITSDFFTSINRSPARKTAEAAVTGAAINIITGFSYGLLSVFPPLVGIALASLVSFSICRGIGPGFGVYGVGAAAFGMLSIVGMVVAGDSFGPIGDNAKGIAEQSGLEAEAVEILDRLDAAGNTSKAITKGFAIGAAGLTVISLLAAFREVAQVITGRAVSFDLMTPVVLLGALVGIAVPAVFSAQLMLGVGKNAFRMIEEVRRQFREIPGLREGREGVLPDYAACVDIATRGAIRELLPASLVAISSTLIVGFVFGVEALGGFLAGTIFSGLIFALLMANAGGLWDNAKKYIEEGALGGKGSETHKAAVIGDTVGDPFKDTAGPSLNTLITVISLVANVFLPLIILYALI
ncbi:potassium transporter [miscellaneous Crenarchaeota group-15 archaeon DG-45]|uniref:K(+)-insensitive pyrophosphate-energized proton pump n=1 Tax=miscellaneous Crenarchaeota group-15 archaeon DG-45 TaxID=1685127 RepID=A0A0M0BR46_9ARCH|nr:MAG: potassium transporter [miscellaneous Crenarchaeota group-15 archaeon DG-45]